MLQGPIVQIGRADEPPFLLPADARVGRAPWVGQVQLVYASTRAGLKWPLCVVACSSSPVQHCGTVVLQTCAHFQMQATIDPGLGGRQPTRWARAPVTYKRLADMPRQMK